MDDKRVRRVAVAGAGIGGLALAQGLRAAGVDVRVFERDPSPGFRRQGYRIHLSEDGQRALERTLPERVYRRVIDTATWPGDLLAGFDAALNPLFEQTFPVTDPDVVTAVDRYAFRRALTTGLDDVLHFGHEIVGYSESADGVEVRFAGGGTTTADVLVGADGVGSRVRAGLLPDLRVVDIGVRCIYGKLPLDGPVRDRVPAPFLRGFCFVGDGGGLGAAFGPVLFREPPAEYGDYLMTVLTGTNEVLGRTDDELWALSPQELWAVAVAATADWHPSVREIMTAADAGTAFPIALRTCLDVPRWRTGRVTLLGDAVHPMTPAAGAGANTALRDAARLTTALTDDDGLLPALAAYEREMAGYAGEIVRESLRNAERMFRVPEVH